MSSNPLYLAPLPDPRTAHPKTRIGKWLFHPELSMNPTDHNHGTQPWYKVLWLTGVDYFSTLGYQPGIALLAAGALSPIATLILIGVTLFCALPTYIQVSRRSFAGQGSIAMLETLMKGWYSKFLVLVMLGFAATDFIITMTLSAADAALHMAENPLLHHHLEHAQVGLTIFLLVVLAAVFLKGFSEAIGIAMMIGIPYIGLNLVVLVSGFWEIFDHPEYLQNWRNALEIRGDWTSLFLVSALVFPKLALGMSGFETGVSVMPLVTGNAKDAELPTPKKRIRNTRKLLTSAALIMSALLLMSSFVTALMIPESAFIPGGEANGRALSYLAHRILGHGFGTVYDISTMMVLWFAGASAMAGMLNLIPRYLPRFGMAPRWVAYRRPLVVMLFGIAAFVTWIFDANVDAQGSAYATGVLALMLSAAVAVAISFWREQFRGRSLYFWLVALVFAYTLIENVVVKPEGIVIAGTFVLGILVFGAWSRWQRALDLRVAEVWFHDLQTADLWKDISDKKVHLVPVASMEEDRRIQKGIELRKHYAFEGPIAFLYVELIDNRSEFISPLRIEASRTETGDVVIVVRGASVIANTIAYVSELLNPISLFIGLTRTNLMDQSMRYLLWGEGETGLMVYRVLLRYWEWTPEEDIRPNIFLMSK